MYFSPAPAIFGQPQDCCGCPKKRATSSCFSWLRYKVATLEREQPLPMPLGGVAIVNRPLRKREAVMGAGIKLDLGIGAVRLHLLSHSLDDLHRRVDIGLGATEMKSSALVFCPARC